MLDRYRMWVHCSPPSVDSIAQCSFLYFKIRKNIKWLFINLIAIGFISTGCTDLDEYNSFILVLICFLNVCYYVISCIILYIWILKLELDVPIHDCNRVEANRQPSLTLVRYFENRSFTFLCRYWEYFNHIVKSLRHIRLKKICQNVDLFRVEGELRNLEQHLKQRHIARAKEQDRFEDCRYRLDSWRKYDRKALIGQSQLDAYWKDYLEATKNEMVKYSIAQNSSWTSQSLDLCPKTNNQDWPDAAVAEKTSYHVPISPTLSCLVYQLSSSNTATDVPRFASGTSCSVLLTTMRYQHKEKNFNPLSWVTNLRGWLSARIKEVIQQLDTANELLKSSGVTDARVGTTDVSILRSIFGAHQLLVSYLPLLDFLTIGHDQGYLMWRYRVLASDGCLRYFSWDTGGTYRGNWNPGIGPNDSELVLHFFSSYLDMKLPCYPSNPTCKRPFFDSYVIVGHRKAPPYTNLAIVQQWLNPPHFNVIVEGNQLEMPHGSNNVFLAIGYLLYCIKAYHNGKIGRVSLGRQGLNILWIIGDNSHH